MSKDDFARNQLTKYGWKKGQGLGANEDGRIRAVTVSVKNNTNGVGTGGDWNAQWWDHVYNKATSVIKVEKDISGEVTIQSSKTAIVAKKPVLYGSFVKSSTTEAEDEDKSYEMKVTDEELFAACEGRTARKGARVDQVGKAFRVGQPLSSAIVAIDGASRSTVTETLNTDEIKVQTNKKKRKHVEKSEEEQVIEPVIEEEAVIEQVVDAADGKVEKIKKSKKKRSHQKPSEAPIERVIPEPVIEQGLQAADEKVERIKKSKKKRSDQEPSEAPPTEPVIPDEQPIKKKKRKHTSTPIID
ncbi:hypothetical protein SmJEL517_g04545 [Synchytrium microbalum]|uniref:G-patch domain-containing protein n=1 Tax=Synchytrium microbalum TaxID=1806994 RepID=A0A507BY39_9FUNG|nr:uncharacterized protein SmJEL517_g04545 [Synchytrium microbalum]TPX32342.1 hypothetical protein SmJEL517_g04545 [Synchytrium microbalum]